MARIFKHGDAKRLGLPGREALEIVSQERGSSGVTLRLATIPISLPGETPRGPHEHRDFEECIYVLSGKGVTQADSGEYALGPGDTLLMAAGEKHVTRNTGEVPLQLLCFFPVGDISKSTDEPGVAEARKKS